MPLIKARSSSIIDSVDLRGQPTAVTAAQSTSTNQLASTAFVRTAIADLIDSSPDLLNTLAELAAAIANDENFATSVATSIATKLPKDGSEAMTGELTLPATVTGQYSATTKKYVDDLVDSQMIYSTDDVPEGLANLYYTATRVKQTISLFSDNTTVLDYDQATGQFTYNHPNSDGILEGATNLYFTNARARQSISMNSDDATIISYSNVTGQITFTTPDTDKIVEGQSNLYFTTARARQSVSGGSNIDYDSSTGIISTQAAVWTVNGQNHTVVLNTDDISEGSANLYFTNTRAASAIALTTDDTNILSYNTGSGRFTFVTPNTDSIDEGSVNLYFTDARVRAAVSASGDISYNQATGNFSYSTPTTDGVNEGSTNLYFTQSRARSSVSLNTDNPSVLDYNSTTGLFTFTLANQTTDDVAEGVNNLYFLTSRARNSISTSGWTNLSYDSVSGVISITAPSTSDVTEGTNLYYTDARVRSAISATDAGGDGSFSYNSATGTFTYTGPNDSEVRAHFGAATSGTGFGGLTYDSATGVYTYAKVTSSDIRSQVSATDLGGDGSFSYDSATGVFTYTGPSASEVRAHISSSNVSGDGSISYDSATGVISYTGPSDSEVRAHFSAIDAGGDGSFSYDSSTGAFTYTGPSDFEVRSHISGNGNHGVDYDPMDGVINLSNIPNDRLAHSKVTVNGYDISLGGSKTLVTDDISEGTTNQYFLNSRARSAISLTSNKPSVLDYNSTTGVFTFDLSNQTTDDVAEGVNNLYYTTARTRADVSANDAGGDGSFSYDSATGVFTYTGPNDSEVRAHFSATTATGVTYNSTTGVIALSSIPNSSLTNSSVTVNGATVSLGGTTSFGTDSVAEESNLYYTQARFDTAFAGKDTDDLAEGSNLYYTQARFDSAFAAKDTSDLAEDPSATVTSGTMYFTQSRARNTLSGGTGVTYTAATGVIAIGQDVSTTSNVTFNDVTVAGDLTVQGTMTAIQSTVVEINDVNLTLAKGSANAAQANGAGLTIDGANATFTYLSGTDSWNLNKDVNITGGLSVTGDLSASMFYGDLTGNVTGNVTGDLYGNASTATALQTPRTIQGVSFDGTGNITVVTAGTGVSVNGTTVSIGQPVGTGDSVSFAGVTSTFTGNLTGNVTGTVSDLSNHTTTDLAEGTNLYYTTARVRSELSATSATGVTYNSTTGVIALSAIPNSSLTNSSVTVNGATVSLGGSTSFDTDSVTEGATNQYFLDSRARSAISLTTSDSTVLDYNSATGVFTFSLAGLDTSEVAEDPNATTSSGTMYFTNARARSAVSANDAGGDGSFSYDSATGVFTYTGPNDSEVRAHFGAATSGTGFGGLTYDSATGVYTYAKVTSSDVRGEVSATKVSGDGAFSYNSATGVFSYTGPDDADYRLAISASNVSGDGSISYNDSTGVISYTGPSASETRAHFSATDLGGDGSFSYDSATGVFTYTGPNDSEVRAHFSATTNTGAQYDSATGVFSLSNIPNSSLTNDSVTFNGVQVALGATGSFGTESVSEDPNATTSSGTMYFTNARARNAISLTTSDPTTFSYNPVTGEFVYDSQGLSTDEVSEGLTNLYFTTQRARDSISTSGWSNLSYDSATGVINISAPSTSDVSEGSNLYFTNARARQAISLLTDNTDALSYDNTTGTFSFTLNSVYTDEIAEGQSNLYFTTARARNTINNGANINYDASTGTISTQAAVWSVNGKDHAVVLVTDDINEGSTNQYFTNARARSAITLTTDDSNILSYNTGTGALTFITPNTDAIDEGLVNLYFTDARADARIAAASILDLSDVGLDVNNTLSDGYSLVYNAALQKFIAQNVTVTVTTLNFTGDGTTTSFNTQVPVNTINDVQVFINGLIQAPTYSFTINTVNDETSVIFDTAPEANDYILVRLTPTAQLSAGGILNENSTIDGGTY
jgi:hypothetical protein